MNFAASASRLFSPGSNTGETSQSAENLSLDEKVIALYEQFRRPLFRYILSFGLSESDVEEVLQEVFLALFRHLRERKPSHNLQAWLFRVAHNQGLKSRTRQESPLDLAWVANALDPDLDPEQKMAQSQQQQRISSAVLALSAQDRECLVLRAEGLRYREIAEIQGISLGAVALSLKRSLARLSEVYGK